MPSRSTPDPAPESTPGPAHECVEWCPICRGAEVLRSGAPPELVDQLHSMQREGLELVRTLIDLYLKRLDEDGRGRREPEPVEEIRIDEP